MRGLGRRVFDHAALLCAVALLAACGGGGGGGSSPPPTPPIQTPPVTLPQPSAFSDANAVPVVAAVFNLLDVLSIVSEMPALAANGFLFTTQPTYTGYCSDPKLGQVPMYFEYDDNDKDGTVSAGDAARVKHSACNGMSRTVSLSIGAVDLPTSSITADVQFDTTNTAGDRTVGSVHVAEVGNVNRTALHEMLTAISATRVAANVTSSVVGAEFDRTFDLLKSAYSFSFSGHGTDGLVGGEFTYAVSRPLVGDLYHVPKDGELVMTAGTTKLRVVPATDPVLQPNYFEYQVDTGSGYGAAKTARWAAVTDGTTFQWNPNAPPVITSLTLSPAAPRVTDTIVASYTADDLDGDALEYSSSWAINNNDFTSLATLSEFPPGRFKKGDVIWYTLRVTDGKATTIASKSITIANTPPNNATITFNPPTVRSVEDLYTEIGARDADGDDLDRRYEWRRNGVVIAGQDASALNHSLYRKGDVITATVFFSDGEASTSASTSTTIKDTLAEMFIGDGPEIHYGQPMTIQMGGTDYDGDPLPGFILEHGPAGMTVNRNTGLVSWTPSGPLFEEETEVSFGIAFDEPGGAVTSTTVTVQDAGHAYPLFRTGLDAPQRLGLTTGDFDHDGFDDLLVVGRRGTLYQLAHKAGGGYRQAWSYPYSIDTEPLFRVATAADVDDADGKPEIFAAMTYGVYRFNGATGRADFSGSAGIGGRPGFVVRDLAIGDLDNDGKPELVILEAGEGDNSPTALGRITVWRLDVMSPRFLDEGPYGTSLALGNVDNDAGLEIVTGGGYVIDGTAVMQGNTGPTAAQWRRMPYFGSQIEVGDVDGDGRDDIVAVEDHANVRVYNAVTQSLSFSITNTDTDALLVADIGGTAAKEIVIGDGPAGGGEIKAYRRASGATTQLFHVPAGAPNVPAIAAGDFDGDGVKELAWAATTATTDLIVIAEANGVVQWSSATAPPQTVTGPFVGGELARTTTNPRAPLFATVRTGTGGMRLVSMNPTNGDLTYSAELAQTASNDATVHVMDYDNDLRDEALVTTDRSTGAFQTAYDFYGATTEWTSAIIAGETGAVASAYGDLNGDNRADLVTVNGFGVIRAYDVFARTLLFQKTLPELTDAVAVAVANVNGTGPAEIVVAGSSRVVVLSNAGAVLRLGPADHTDIRDMLVADIDGDGAPEIFILYGAPMSQVQRFDGNLVARGGFTAEWLSSFITVEASPFARKNLVLYESSLSAASMIVVDPKTGQEIWYSPKLFGEIAPDGVHFVDVAGDGRLRMTIATDRGMLITR